MNWKHLTLETSTKRLAHLENIIRIQAQGYKGKQLYMPSMIQKR